MHQGMKALAIASALAALGGCKRGGDRGDGSVEMEVRCDAPGGYCPCRVEVHSDHRYLFCPDVVTWEEARDNCRRFGFELVTIESEPEQAFVWGIAEETDGDYWIGLSDRESEGAFVWSDGSALGTSAPWANEQPDSGDGEVEEDCVELIQSEEGRWNDRDCETDYLDYVCELD